MTAKDMVDAISKGDNINAQKAFDTAMTDKVGTALEAERKTIANTFIKAKEEEVAETD